MSALRGAALSEHAGQVVSKRSLYLTVSPAPTTLSQRRAILHMLKKHGKIEVFKQLPEVHSFISVAESSNIAKTLIARSPVELKYGDNPSSSSSKKSAAKNEDSEDASSSSTKEFVINIFSANNYPHKRAIRHNRISGPWPVPRPEMNPTENIFAAPSLATLALRQTVPTDVAWKGMTDWESCDQCILPGDEPTGTALEGIRDETVKLYKRYSARRKMLMERWIKGDEERAVAVFGEGWEERLRKKTRKEQEEDEEGEDGEEEEGALNRTLENSMGSSGAGSKVKSSGM
ncbi:hypothetical protein QBC35DRAFT_61965 [Podospora australis]|uniref:Uncharacterized protein n=1 Tax=Podospora australis TaxID=1536484 RepID=A0AAN6WZ38_9PEZI|nr:hypothetical protein QBC35DRAFT_61965 [Podospora australis]